MIEPTLELPVTDQCRLLDLARSTYYYQSTTNESEENLALWQEIDRTYLAHPENGSPMMVRVLKRKGHKVNRKRVQRLMRLVGIASLPPQPSTTKPHPAHPKYPYLLRNLSINQPNQVWCADITYISFKKGFLYLVAIMDWRSRKVLSWRVSNSMTTNFCLLALPALHKTLALCGTPEIFNTDQGSQFISGIFTGILKEADIAISMDGAGRAIDNVFI
jgi:putative transposase